MQSISSSVIPAAFPALALAHFLALLSPGPDFFLIVGHAIRRRLKGSFWLCAGIALGNALYIILAIAGWSAIRQSPSLYGLLEVAGALYLFWLGRMLVRSSRGPAGLSLNELPPLARGRQLAVGLCSALLNPKNAIFYLTLMTVLVGESATLAQQSFAGIWMICVVFLWDVGLAAAISHPAAQRVLEKRIRAVELIAGTVLILFALALVVEFIRRL